MRAALIRGCSFTLEYTQIPNVLPETMLVAFLKIQSSTIGTLCLVHRISAGRDTMTIRGAFLFLLPRKQKTKKTDNDDKTKFVGIGIAVCCCRGMVVAN